MALSANLIAAIADKQHRPVLRIEIDWDGDGDNDVIDYASGEWINFEGRGIDRDDLNLIASKIGKKTVIKTNPCNCPPCRRRYNKEKAR